MKRILTPNEAIKLATEFNNQNKSIVILGGCFDILHLGHIELLKKAKSKGDFVFLLLESDATIKKLKGSKRPINSQEHRAQLLENLRIVDYVVKLPEMNNNDDYDSLIIKISPSIIATTKGDKGIKHKKRQAKTVGARILTINTVPQKSTTLIEEIILKEL